MSIEVVKLKVAVILSTYNGQGYIREFLKSLYEQTFRDFTLFVRDDGSVDSTLDIVREFSNLLEIKFLESGINLGAAKSFFEAVKAVSDDYSVYFFADQDDIWMRNKMEVAINELASTKKSLYVSAYNIFSDKRGVFSRSKILNCYGFYNALCESIGPGCTMAFTRELRDRFVDEGIPDGVMHDRWIYFLAALGDGVFYDAVPLINYRVHENNTIGVSLNCFEVLSRRLSNLNKQSYGIYSISKIASHFCDGSHLKMGGQFLKHLCWLKKGKESLWFRLISSIFIPFERNSLVDNIMLRFLVFINRY